MRGKEHSHTDTATRHKDHPRLCGEKTVYNLRCCFMAGSPPPMRGKESIAKASIPPPGITPAYAGKSQLLEVETTRQQDHPRLCGEKENQM